MLKIYVSSFILDLLLGDPSWLPHPVRFIGKIIEFLNRYLFTESKNKEKELINGTILFVFTIIIVGTLTYLILAISSHISHLLSLLVNIYLFYSALALKDLRDATIKVYKALDKRDLFLARFHLSQIVGRDTEKLSEREIVRATIETIAESFSDGVVAPMVYFLLGGNILTWIYKGVNTLDSMVGYKFYPYTYYGRISAKADDLLNFIPSRLSALSLLFFALITGRNAKKGFYIFKRDRKNHPSPNGGNPESAMAGILGVRLGGVNYYKGHRSVRGLIGDPERPFDKILIKEALTMIYGASFILFIAGGLILWFLKKY